ncbi:uncharacterized protein DEA37_0013811 [Paragonimus westermani]|uniref:Uncharacterized protein n=1 Tax=Paragonimus westermani TaxID=34504 RepID=A0A5J4NVD7_9TREM|nr:uncharacterized protein DEA37_0013811 [Paragonimus westermani]
MQSEPCTNITSQKVQRIAYLSVGLRHSVRLSKHIRNFNQMAHLNPLSLIMIASILAFVARTTTQEPVPQATEKSVQGTDTSLPKDEEDAGEWVYMTSQELRELLANISLSDNKTQLGQLAATTLIMVNGTAEKKPGTL